MTSPRRRLASVQELLPLEEISGEVVQLHNGECRAVLEAGSVNFALKSESEQEAILAGYRRFLNALAYPLQIFVRVVPTDVEAYIDGLRGQRNSRAGETMHRLALDHEAFVRRIARERTLLDRRFYVVVPAELDGAAGQGGIRRLWRRQAEQGARRAGLATAQRKLAFRCSEVMQGLASFGVPSRRLAGDELAALWRAALSGGAVRSGGAPLLATPVVSSREARRGAVARA